MTYFSVAPAILSTDPRYKKSVLVGSKAVLTCTAEGNPEPSYEWLQQLPSGEVQKRSSRADLVIEDVGYDDQGGYICLASNRVGGGKREVQSGVVRLEVAGAPQVVKKGKEEVTGVIGSDVELEGQFCSDPVPVRNTWEWGGVVLPTGSQIDGRYEAELVSDPDKEDCYLSRLVIRGLEMGDSRTYMLNVENIHGRGSLSVLLHIEGTNINIIF